MLDKLAPFFRGDTARLVLGYVNDLDPIFQLSHLLAFPLVSLASHLIGVPPVIANELITLIRDVQGNGCDKVARAEELKITIVLWVHPGAVDDRPLWVNATRRAQLHLGGGKGVSNDVAGDSLEVFTLTGLDAAAAVDAEPRMLPTLKHPGAING